MRRLDLLAISAVCLTSFGVGVRVWAQQVPPQQAAPQVMGTVATQDALVTGGLQVEGDRAQLVSNDSVTAQDRTAAVALTRGGEVLVCATSQFHLLHAGTGPSLLFGLDRGALEIHSASKAQDVILTPDIRFTVEAPGTFDLGLRVTSNGDTCVDNAGKDAPVLLLSDAFSSASYRVMPGQHVLFEQGNLREVVDNEQSPCGCPAAVQAPVESAAGVSAPAAAAAEHPFPAAASEGLAPESAPANSAPAGEKHTQIAATLAYGPGEGPPPAMVPAPGTGASASAANGAGDGAENGPAAPPKTPPGAHDLAHAIGRFFHRLFHPGNKSGRHPAKSQASSGS